MNGRVMAAQNAAKGLYVAALALAALRLSGRWECRASMSMRKVLAGQIQVGQTPIPDLRVAHVRTPEVEMARVETARVET